MNNSTNNNRKEEILAKSRQAKKDEGLEYAEAKGMLFGERTMSITGIIVGLVAIFYGQFEALFAVATVILAHVIGQSYSTYRFKRSKYYLAWLIVGVVGTLYFFMLFIAATQEWTALLDRLWRFA